MAAHARQVHAISKICLRAREGLDKMKPTFLLLDQHRDREHNVFRRGTNKKGMIRLLVDVKCAVQIFRNFSYEQYVAVCGHPWER